MAAIQELGSRTVKFDNLLAVVVGLRFFAGNFSWFQDQSLWAWLPV